MSLDRRGVALLEVLIAVVILATAGLSLVEFVAASVRSLEVSRQREAELVPEERLLTAYCLLSQADLDRRLGSQRLGAFLVNVQRPERGLYRIAVSRRRAPNVEDLVTVVFRAEDYYGS